MLAQGFPDISQGPRDAPQGPTSGFHGPDGKTGTGKDNDTTGLKNMSKTNGKAHRVGNTGLWSPCQEPSMIERIRIYNDLKMLFVLDLMEELLFDRFNKRSIWLRIQLLYDHQLKLIEM